MKLPRVLRTTMFLVVLNTGMQSTAQLVAIGNVVGAPFTATWTWTQVETKSGLTETTTILATAQLARDRNGSTYEAVIKSGHPTAIWIVDVLKNLKIEIRPLDFTYRYIPISDPAVKLRTHSVEEIFKVLQNQQEGIIEHPDHPSTYLPRWHFTALGCRQENRFNLCGVRDESSSNTGEEHIRETWWSDLGMIMTSIQKADHLAGTVNDLRFITDRQDVTNLRRVDPDSQLFEIPAGYKLELPLPKGERDGR